VSKFWLIRVRGALERAGSDVYRTRVA
jgi:hypothetical protein